MTRRNFWLSSTEEETCSFSLMMSRLKVFFACAAAAAAAACDLLVRKKGLRVHRCEKAVSLNVSG